MSTEETRLPQPDDPVERTVVPPGAGFAAAQDPEATQVGPTPAPSAARTLLGVVAVYSTTGGDPGDPPSEAGRVYALCEGDVLFIGKSEAKDLPLPDGRVLRVTHAHLLTMHEEHAHASREHLALLMFPGGKFRLYDFSSNGIYLERRQQHLRRRPNVRPEVHELEGRETLVLGIDLGTQRDRKARERAARSKVQVVPFAGATTATAEETKR